MNHMTQDANASVTDLLSRQIPGQWQRDETSRLLLTPGRVLWVSEPPGGEVANAEILLQTREPQIALEKEAFCVLRNTGAHAGLLLDFGTEVCGGVRIAVWNAESPEETSHVRIRFGESAMEAMSEPGEKNAGNCHSMRDFTAELPHLGTFESGGTGFRFVRIDLLDDGRTLEIKAVQACAVFRDIPYIGSFRCSDERLDRIWQAGAYTVHLNMQNGLLWDGVKRDRLVWMGDIFPEIRTVETVFGADASIARSLDFARERTPLPGWMNGIPTYSMWWILSQYARYLYTGDAGYLGRQAGYLRGLMEQLDACIAPDGRSAVPPVRFLDWETQDDPQATDAGIQALHVLAAGAAEKIFRALGDEDSAVRCRKSGERLRGWRPACSRRKQAAALMALAGLADPAEAGAVLAAGGAEGVSAYMGYGILKARALAGDISGCLDCIRRFWGGMLELGSTTFWESFDVEWMKHAARIDELPGEGQVDVHGGTGAYCYEGYRKSLCHGWASGPTPWLTEYVLGIRVVQPGCRVIRLEPHLGDLAYAEGRFPTPWGVIRVHHRKQADGSVRSTVSAPDEIRLIRS